MLITKANGEEEQFDEQKLRRSLERAGAHKSVIDDVVREVRRSLKPGMTTSLIYRHAFDVLRRHERQPVAARYSLRRAVMDLGPSGFPFESLIAEIFRKQGFSSIETDIRIQGKCVEHEVDVIAESKDKLILTEAKFHNRAGFKTDLKVTLYIDSRARDLHATGCNGREKKGKETEFWLVTNTKFTRNAVRYGKCSGLVLVGWNYPDGKGVQYLIESTGLHPLTCLTTLSAQGKRALFDQGIVLCRDIKDNVKRLVDIGLSEKDQNRVQEEAGHLCTPRF